MVILSGRFGPAGTNVYLLGDPAAREALVIDAAIPSFSWLAAELASRSWALKLIVTTHGHWDHIGDNAAVAQHTLAPIAVHPLDAPRLSDPQPLFAPFEIPPSVPAVELAEGGEIRFGEIRLAVMHTPGHTEGSVCLASDDDGLVLSGDTLFRGAWGRTDLPGGDDAAMVESISRLARLPDGMRVLPGHGDPTTIGRERAWMDIVARERRLLG